MKHLLVGINAKYIHTNLAIRSIAQYIMTHSVITPTLCEFTINQQPSDILAALYKEHPDSIGFSCYIWNYGMVCRLLAELKQVLPHCILYLGGPEVTYTPKEVLLTTMADCVTVGEGEFAVLQLLSALEQGAPYSAVPNLCYREGETICCNEEAPLLPMEDLPFVYDDTTSLAHKILYYESSRGCPFRCQYCLSCNDQGVRARPLPQIFEHLQFFLQQQVRQVKFVDRTFNFNRKDAVQIWEFLKAHDNGYTNFHFEIAAELLDEESIRCLSTARKGYFQLEIGVQSTNPETLKAICRFTNLQKLQSVIAALRAPQNIHLHLDLIAGLPHEGYDRFATSFNDVYQLQPDQLQLGFLKLLKGSGLYENRAQYGLVHSEAPPYEILYTDALTFGELLRLKGIEEMVEVYYNSNRFTRLLSYLVPMFASPFAFFETLADFFEGHSHHLVSHTAVAYYDILFDFAKEYPLNHDLFCALARFDLYTHEKARRLPSFLSDQVDADWKRTLHTFYQNDDHRHTLLPEYDDCDPKQVLRMTHLLALPYNPFDFSDTPCYYLFNYRRVDLLGNAHYLPLSPSRLEGVPHATT